MSRILRRPLFRGGSVDSRGTGITSGLTEEPRVKAQQGLFMGMDPRYSGFGTKPILTSEDLIQSYTPSGIPQSLQDLYQSNVSQRVDEQRFPTITKEEEDETIISNYPIDRLAERDQIVPFNLSANKDNETKTTDDDSATNRENNLIPKPKPKPKDPNISDLEKDDTEINLEDIFAERIKRAKRGDIADILLGASEGFLEEGTLMGGAKGAVRAGRAPSRTEQAKQSQENVLLQKAFAESKSKSEFEQAVKLLGIRSEYAKELAKLKGGKQFELDRQLQLLGPDLLTDKVKKAAYGATNLPEYLRNVKKDLAIGDEIDLPTVVAGTKIFAPDLIGTASSLEDIKLDGVYIIPEQKKVIRVKNTGTPQVEFEDIAIF